MTIPELIDSVLGAVRNQFYPDRDREYYRDKRALSKAIAKYGYICAERGWEFSVDDILHDLLGLLNEIKRTGADPKYFPAYLGGAVDRHVRMRAEELSARAKMFRQPRVDKMISGLDVVKVVVRPDNTQILAAVYSDLKLLSESRRKKKAGRKPKQAKPEPIAATPRETQEVLL